MDTDRFHLYIDGRFVTPTEPPVQVLDSTTAEPIGIAGAASEADIDAAVRAAGTAFPAWSARPAAERAEILDRFATALAARSDMTAQLVSRENGMPITLSTRANGLFPVGLLRYYAGLSRELDWESSRPSMVGHTVVRRVPVGVVAAIAPWNYPQTLAMMKIAPALAAGCTVVFKAPLETALDAFVLADAADDAGVPPGVLNVVPAGIAASQHLVAHPDVAKVAFTGSTPAGRAIAETCGRLLRPVTLELGGKSAGIVLDDVDLDVLTEGLYGASFPNNGQTCYASTRLLVPASRYDEIVDAVTDVVAGYSVGDPLDASVLIGPMVSAAHRDRVQGYIDGGKKSGARVTVGGNSVNDIDGFFVAPTVFVDVDNNDRLAREEIFGPVLSIIKYDSDDDAIAMANASDYGLGGTVWSSDDARATGVARRIASGTVGINGYSLDLGSPFGGVKASGYGRELGPEALDSYLVHQSIYKMGAA